MEKKYFVSDVITAIGKRELKVYYQPKFDATTNRMKSAEALVRWIRSDGSVVLPERFLPVMEQSDAITMLDWYVVEEDILQIQSESAAVSLLLQAVCMRYPLIIYGNLTKNSFYMMTYDNFTSRSCPSTGCIDDLIAHGAMSMHPEDRERWGTTFSRENQLRLHRAGQREIHLITRQIGDDGVCRRVETSNYFVKSPASEDVLVISLCNNIGGE